MGFHVELDENSKELVNLLTLDPGRVLGKSYAAYILFLVGETDTEELKWLVDNAKALDSVTGDNVAYAVFAESFKVKLKTFSDSQERPPRNVGRVQIDESFRTDGVKRLVKNGRVGIVADGDELTAITYGTDFVARELGILDQLPCLVVIDSIPQDKLCVVQLDSDLTSSLMKLMRKSVSRFEVGGGAEMSKGIADQVLSIQKQIAHVDVSLKFNRPNFELIDRKIERLKKHFESGERRETPELRAVLTQREALRQELEGVDKRMLASAADEVSQLELNIKNLLSEYKAKKNLLFSEIFTHEVHALGLKSKIASGKARTFSFLGSLFNPEMLLKIWETVHH